jgi:tRNA G37 N-methylase TrmD
VLNVNISEFMIELKDGSIKNVGAPTKAAEAKLFDPDDVEVREFGDSQVKVVATDESGNEVQIAMLADQFEDVLDDANALREESRVFE